MKRFSFVALSSLAVALSSCAGVKSITVERPKDEAFRTALRKEISYLSVPIEASSEELGRTLNKTIRQELYKGSTRTRGLTADVLRNGPISVSAADNYLYFTLPITLALSYGIFETQAIPLKLKFKARANVTADWRLNAEIYYAGLSDLLVEEFGIGPLSIRPRSIVEGVTQPIQKALSDLINSKINESFPLKAQVAKAWTAAQKPVLLDQKYNAWLKLVPQEVMLSPLSAQNNKVRLSVGINSFAEVVIGPEPAARPVLPLPNLKPVNTFDRNFRIALNTDLFYKDILSIASPLLLNKEIDSDGKTIIITAMDIYGNGDRIVVKLETKGSLEGVFYLTCKPRFNQETNIFSVEEVDFDMQTQSVLLQSADWFLHGAIKGVIQEKLNMDLSKRLEQSREMAQKALNQVKLADHIFMKGEMKTLKVNDVVVQKDRISIQLYTDGESAIIFQ